jgi:ABC-type antimicrobial peptide transport system permease subunit
MFVAITGLYGLLSYETSHRIREFGIRAAVGAQKIDLAALLLKEVATIVLGGAAMGVASCLLFVHLVASALYGVRPMDPISFVGALLSVGLIVSAASWQPVLQAMNVDVSTVLNDE